MSLPITQLDVVNQALMEIGSLPVTSVTDNEKAILINAKIDLLLPVLLTSTPWKFAVKYVTDNTPLTVDFSPDYQYTYQLPADYGRFWKFSTNVYPLQWQIVDNLLQIDVRPVSYYYIVNTVDFTYFTPLFYRALALYAASDVAFVLTNNADIAKYLFQKYEDARNNAILLDDMEREVSTMPFNDFDRQVFV